MRIVKRHIFIKRQKLPSTSSPWLAIGSTCDVMKKVESLGEVSKWEGLNRDILGLIFKKLDVMDLTMGASRVCISWFLASQNRTLWNTVNLTKIQLCVSFSRSIELKNKLGPLFLYKQRFVDDRKDSGVSLMTLLIKITNLSNTAPKNLFFKLNSHIDDDDLMFATEKMPNIEKLVLPISCCHTKESYWFAFSQWKNLKTLIIPNKKYYTGKIEFQALGENCSNLTNLKYWCSNMEECDVEEIVRCLQSLKRLSLRGSVVSDTGVLSLINGLQNLIILNLSHCKDSYLDPISKFRDGFVQAAIQKLEKLIMCDQDCRFCNNRYCYLRWSHISQNWESDEMKEFEF